MTSEPVLQTLSAAGPPRSSCRASSRCRPRIASSRPVCTAAAVLVSMLIPLITGAAPLPPPRPREQGPEPSSPPAPVQPAPALPPPAGSPPDEECLSGLQRLGL